MMSVSSSKSSGFVELADAPLLLAVSTCSAEAALGACGTCNPTSDERNAYGFAVKAEAKD